MVAFDGTLFGVGGIGTVGEGGYGLIEFRGRKVIFRSGDGVSLAGDCAYALFPTSIAVSSEMGGGGNGCSAASDYMVLDMKGYADLIVEVVRPSEADSTRLGRDRLTVVVHRRGVRRYYCRHVRIALESLWSVYGVGVLFQLVGELFYVRARYPAYSLLGLPNRCPPALLPGLRQLLWCSG